MPTLTFLPVPSPSSGSRFVAAREFVLRLPAQKRRQLEELSEQVLYTGTAAGIIKALCGLCESDEFDFEQILFPVVGELLDCKAGLMATSCAGKVVTVDGSELNIPYINSCYLQALRKQYVQVVSLIHQGQVHSRQAFELLADLALSRLVQIPLPDGSMKVAVALVGRDCYPAQLLEAIENAGARVVYFEWLEQWLAVALALNWHQALKNWTFASGIKERLHNLNSVCTRCQGVVVAAEPFTASQIDAGILKQRLQKPVLVLEFDSIAKLTAGVVSRLESFIHQLTRDRGNE